MLEYLKNYYVCMLVLMIFSFLVPREDYKSYIQFFVGIFLIVVLLKPVLKFVSWESPAVVYEMFEEFYVQIEEMEQVEGGSIYDFFKGEGE